MATFTTTKEQNDILSYFETNFGPEAHAMFIDALAGTGKTSTLVLLGQVVKRIQDSGKNVNGCMIAFNKVIAKALKTKLAEFGVTGIEAKTTNSLGNAILTEAASNGFCPKQRLDTHSKKYSDIVFKHVNKNKGSFPGYKIPKGLVGHLTKMVKFARVTFIDPTEENLLAMVEHYGIDIDITSSEWQFAWSSVRPLIEEGVKMFRDSGVLDFDDQIFLPLYLDLTAPIYDLICSDEAQDFNAVRLQLTQRCIKPNGFLIYVGDENQAMQGFTGSDTDSVNTIKRTTKAVVFPLTTCWRCDADIIRVAQAIVPRIKARSNAPKGVVDMISESMLVKALEPGYKRGKEVKDGDLVLCRINADLVKYCLEAIRHGKYAIIRGRSIGRGIIAFIDRAIEKAHTPVTINNLADIAAQVADQEKMALALSKNAEDQIAKIDDKLDSLDAFISGFKMDHPEGGIDDLKVYINEKFSGDDDEVDEEQDNCILPIIFSTVHKAKGLEFDRVFIIRPDLMPFPAKNQKPWQEKQEYNILYVACTRAKHELYFVGGIPTPVQDIVEDIMDESFSGKLATEEEAIAIVESIIAPVVETPIAVEPVAAPEPIIVEQTASTPETRYPVAQGRGKGGAKKDTKGVAYNFPPELCDKLDQVAQLILDATGEKFDKSAYVAGRIFGQYLDIDALIASLQDQDNNPDPDNGGGAPVPETSHEEKKPFGEALASFFDMAIQDAAQRGYTVQAIVSTPNPVLPVVTSHNHVETPVLFDSPIDPDKAYRRFYHCGSKFCKHKWGYDYHVDPAINQFYRLDSDGRRITAEEDAKCPKCGNDGKWTKKRTLKATYNPGLPESNKR